ncbi:MAG: flagellar export chaperone FliS [Oceanospirillales bacterium]|uniref:Flagellar secretion chaperone FliS n=1 Tax=Marinobacterium halophilum TaxID=267374 RepID=A0A2P8ES81_9GAMM|nr:flagellar export chaperone FliS [Marinobacterium halophilum]MBR9827682.1 flagellar export chaperone FliS [Oceanospirillales bacterium]PSL12347.1 flagellar protein FliS [Marinobacterium halophilum]
MMNKALNQYKSVDLNTAVEAASPHQLISMLFRGALEALAKSMGAIERKDIQLRTQQINKACEIVVTLKGSLNFEQGGEVAENLDNLYDYMLRTLMQANRESDAAKVKEVSGLIATIAEGWTQIPAEEHQTTAYKAS